MSSLFNYNTLKVALNRETRTLEVTLNRPHAENAFCTEMIFELETLFAWTTSHLEIHSILINSSTSYFSPGWDRKELEKMNDERIQKLMERLQKLVYIQFFLPQTVIIDLGDGARGAAAEFAIGADIRLAKNNTDIQFDHIRKGLIPACGGVGFLSAVVPPSFARRWSLSTLPLSENDMLASGFIAELYSEKQTINSYLQAIASQAPVARIQTKRSLLDTILPALDRARNFEKDYAIAGMCMGDWRKALWAERDDLHPEFTSAKEMASMLQKEREDTVSH